ncbi:restriction endonuclease [Mycobacteroides sp. LB1]|uniref:restriction endonuclease n=1 Tax=Mycobacteroides sp. LB1 TaxID=2750814 RepID=UPI0015DF46D1|nr:restriction endonuclease [Mycobacteroides sp. LB1]
MQIVALSQAIRTPLPEGPHSGTGTQIGEVFVFVRSTAILKEARRYSASPATPHPAQGCSCAALSGLNATMNSMKRISGQGYQALRDALAVTTWYKKQFERLLRDALRAHSELLTGLDFNNATKRETADTLVDRLMTDETTYQSTTIDLMTELAGMKHFPDIEAIKDRPDRELRLQQARQAVTRLQDFLSPYLAGVESNARSVAAKKAHAEEQDRRRRFSDELSNLRERYIAMHDAGDPHKRGKDFEILLADLFLLFDMEPRLSYSLPHEQIDGSLSFDTDDYIVEARWRKEPTEPGDLHIFKAKVETKGRNALGIFVSVNGFTAGALELYSSTSPFIVFTGDDIYTVLDGRITLDDLLRQKKRHVNETGNCYLPARGLTA